MIHTPARVACLLNRTLFRSGPFGRCTRAPRAAPTSNSFQRFSGLSRKYFTEITKDEAFFERHNKTVSAEGFVAWFFLESTAFRSLSNHFRKLARATS